MRLDAYQREWLRAQVDLQMRRKRRMKLPDGVRALCAAHTERHTECSRNAREGSEFCGQHQSYPSRVPRI